MLNSLRRRWANFQAAGYTGHRMLGPFSITLGLDWASPEDRPAERLDKAPTPAGKATTEVEALHLDAWIEADVQKMQKAYPRMAAEGCGVPSNTEVSNWRWPNQLTEAEQKVFDLDLDTWPRCAVALAAYAHFTGEGNLTDYPDWVYVAARESHRYIYEAKGREVEAFAEFAYVFCGLNERDAYAAFWKEEAWHLREGHRYFIRLTHDPRRDDGHIPF